MKLYVCRVFQILNKWKKACYGLCSFGLHALVKTKRPRHGHYLDSKLDTNSYLFASHGPRPYSSESPWPQACTLHKGNFLSALKWGGILKIKGLVQGEKNPKILNKNNATKWSKIDNQIFYLLTKTHPPNYFIFKKLAWNLSGLWHKLYLFVEIPTFSIF